MHTNKINYLFSSKINLKLFRLLINSWSIIILGTACTQFYDHRYGMTEFEYNEHYLRNMVGYPLASGESGEEINPEPGKCNNFNYRFRKDGPGREDRKYGEADPKWIMQHYTAGNFISTASHFTNNKTIVSAHYVINKDGTVYYFVGDQYRAYHAGRGSLAAGSKLNPDLPYDVLENDMNSWSIGIENVNSGTEPYTNEQIRANVRLCQQLVTAHPTIDPKRMLGHSDWAPKRKMDPGLQFPWADFANAADNPKFNDLDITKNLGIYPTRLDFKSNPDIVLPYEKANKLTEDETEYQIKLKEYGYDIPEEDIGKLSTKTSTAIQSFRLHFTNGNGSSPDAGLNENHMRELDNILDQFSS